MEVSPMKTMTITITMPDQVELPFGASEQEFARELRLAAAIHWYDRGLISQGKGAEIAGLTRSEFIDALSAAHVDVLQVTPEELREELERTLDARR
jgi:predicted HTH domain antitoxin